MIQDFRCSRDMIWTKDLKLEHLLYSNRCFIDAVFLLTHITVLI